LVSTIDFTLRNSSTTRTRDNSSFGVKSATNSNDHQPQDPANSFSNNSEGGKTQIRTIQH
jgi:hypothetical protein